MNKIKVSVCIQTYNQVNYIKECLEGVLSQKTTFKYEILLGEDESSDGTREICQLYAENYPQIIKFIPRNRKDVIHINGRVTGRYNFKENLKISKGQYIAICEGDDYWTDTLKLQKQVDFLDNNLDYGICYHKVRVFSQDDGRFTNRNLIRDVKEITTIRDLAKGNFIHTPSVMFRNQIEIPAWFDRVNLGDWCLYMMLIKNNKIRKLNYEMAVYRKHGNSMWSSTSLKDRKERTRQDIQIILNNLDFEDEEVVKILRSRLVSQNQSSNEIGFIHLLKKVKQMVRRFSIK